MRFKLRKASSARYESTVEIDTLQDLKNLYIEKGFDLVIDFDPYNEEELDGLIIIWDDYL